MPFWIGVCMVLFILDVGIQVRGSVHQAVKGVLCSSRETVSN